MMTGLPLDADHQSVHSIWKRLTSSGGGGSQHRLSQIEDLIVPLSRLSKTQLCIRWQTSGLPAPVRGLTRISVDGFESPGLLAICENGSIHLFASQTEREWDQLSRGKLPPEQTFIGVDWMHLFGRRHRRPVILLESHVEGKQPQLFEATHSQAAGIELRPAAMELPFGRQPVLPRRYGPLTKDGLHMLNVVRGPSHEYQMYGREALGKYSVHPLPARPHA